MHALIFANGSSDDGPLARQVLAQSEAPLLIAADGGLHVAQDFGVEVQVVIGDMDSAQPEALEERRRAGAQILTYPVEKDETDLELALLWAIEQGATQIRIFGAMGGRLDQTLANIFLLALPALRGGDTRLVSGTQEAWLLYAGTHRITGHEGDTVSLIPIWGVVQNINTGGLYYSLKSDRLLFGPARGISNVMLADEVSVSFQSGMLLVVRTMGHA